jgi:transcriptional regulator with XRE-family HTH domain
MGGIAVTNVVAPDDFADRVKTLRGRLALTQTQMAACLGVAFATVNRWENARARPSVLRWSQLQRLFDAEIGGPQREPKIPDSKSST